LKNRKNIRKVSYCKYCSTKSTQDINRIYHDTKYGFPIDSDDELFGRLILEINQAGLSWEIILKKEQNFKEAFDSFSIKKIARYDEDKFHELMLNSGIIRNKLKIRAVIFNANKILEIQDTFGSFKSWLDEQNVNSKEEWVRLFKKNFKFVGGEIVNEFLMSSGYLKGAHERTCPIFDEIIVRKPNWLKYEKVS
jgi:DNA-3-methyladenine glycosylase I